jgi:hypothetical protein
MERTECLKLFVATQREIEQIQRKLFSIGSAMSLDDIDEDENTNLRLAACL